MNEKLDEGSKIRPALKEIVEAALAAGSFQNLDSLQPADLEEIYSYLGYLESEMRPKFSAFKDKLISKIESNQSNHMAEYLVLMRQHLSILILSGQVSSLNPLSVRLGIAGMYESVAESLKYRIKIAEEIERELVDPEA
jgi:hypothetical protein